MKTLTLIALSILVSVNCFAHEDVAYTKVDKCVEENGGAGADRETIATCYQENGWNPEEANDTAAADETEGTFAE